MARARSGSTVAKSASMNEKVTAIEDIYAPLVARERLDDPLPGSYFQSRK